MLLAGDVGATKADLAIYTQEAGPHAPLVEATLPSSDYPDLASLLESFIGQTGLAVERVVVGVAGPAVAGRVEITNLDWAFDEAGLSEALGGIEVRLLNDLLATAYAVPHLRADDLHVIHRGQPEPGGALAVIAPGTGLGEGFMTWDGVRYRPCPSEGGHASWAPGTPLQAELWSYLHTRHGHVSNERVCSGLGIPNLYAFLKARGGVEPTWLAEALAAAEDPTPVIVTAGLGGEAGAVPLCAATLDLFVEILAGEAGSLALRVLATGGVFLGGGIPPRILTALGPERFMERFAAKGRLHDLLMQVPVSVILNPRAARMGAAVYGLG